MKALFIILVTLVSCGTFSQLNYNICKFDTAKNRVIIQAKREYMADLKNTIKVVKEIEAKYLNFKNISLLFFDGKEDCEMLIEAMENNDSLRINYDPSAIKNYLFADFSTKTRIFEYYKQDGSFSVMWSMIINEETKL